MNPSTSMGRWTHFVDPVLTTETQGPILTGVSNDGAQHVQWFDAELEASRTTVLRAIDQLDDLRATLEAEAQRSVERRAELRALVEQSARRSEDRRSGTAVTSGPQRRSTDRGGPESQAGFPTRDRRRRPMLAESEPIGINQQRFRN